MIYTHYDYLEIAPGAPRERIEAAYARVLERFNYGITPAGRGELERQAGDWRTFSATITSLIDAEEALA